MVRHEDGWIPMIIIGLLMMIAPFVCIIYFNIPTEEISEQTQIACGICVVGGFFVSLISYIQWHDGDECGSGQMW